MRVECPTCSKVYNVPDERLTYGKKFAFRCPTCKGTFKLDLHSTNDMPEKSKQDSSASDRISQSKYLKKKIIKSIKDLAPMPKVIHKAREVMSKPHSTFKEIGKVIETDQAIAANVLKMANSAYYGLSGMVSSIHQAIVVLGYETLGQLINTAGASKLLTKTLKGYGLQSGVLWKHSLAVAFGAKIIAVNKMPPLENDAFTAGLLHDVGKLILDEHIFERKSIFDKLSKKNNSFLKAEEELFGFDHSEIASLICEQWHFPENQILAIKYHHDPSSSQEMELAYFLHLADCLARKCGFGTEIIEESEMIKDNTLETIGFEEEDLLPIMDEIIESVGNISQSMF